MGYLNGRVRKFPDNVDTDIIAPASALQLPIESLKQHAFSPLFPNFHRSVQAGDIIVAGGNFGCGSSREKATAVIKALDIQYVICDSMARIYFRNCIAVGLHPIVSKGVSSIFAEGDGIDIDLKKGTLNNPATGETARFQPFSDMPKMILESGGILTLLKAVIDSGTGDASEKTGQP
jgi:3-isopropylmalate/(R)-2-methylmalate dehydratase small subunit